MRRPIAVLIPPLLLLALTGCVGPETGFDIAADGTCDPEQLQITVTARDDADPELVVVDVVLRNRGDECVLDGYPRITLLSLDQSVAIGGEAAHWGAPPEKVTIPWKSSAYVIVQARKSLADTATCIGELASGMSVVLPGRDEPIVSSSPVAKYCDEPSRGTLLVSAVAAEALVVDSWSDYVEPY